MNGQQLITHAIRAEMPDKDTLRQDCINLAERQTNHQTNHQTMCQTNHKAKTQAAPKRKRGERRIIPAAACATVCVTVVIVAALVLSNPLSNPFSNPNNNPAGNLAVRPGSPPDQSQTGDANPFSPTNGVFIPALELPTTTSDTAMDMIGLFVYQGKIYTQGAWYYNEDARAIKSLIGERVGYAKGTIDEWSSQDEYAEEFAGSAAGDVFTVQGYDPQFRLCMMGDYTDEDGNRIEWVNFFENLNGITLTTGFDLFGERLALRENWHQALYQRHDDWDYDKQVLLDIPGVTDTEVNAFIDALYAGKFEYVYETLGADKFYTPSQKQAHVYFQMNDNTCVELRLFEGGYVGYQHLGWYFVKIPGESFDTLFNACQ